MTATIYKDAQFQGIFASITSGLYSGRQLTGCHNQSNSCEELNNAINSIRVGTNTIVVVADNLSITASGGGSRTFIGPMDIPDLSTVGMANKISSILVIPFKSYNSAQPASCGVTLFDSYGGQGRRAKLTQGDYPNSRLISEEVKFSGKNVISIDVGANAIAILYDSDNFEQNSDSIVCVGRTLIDDVQSIGMLDKIKSIRVMCSDPGDAPSIVWPTSIQNQLIQLSEPKQSNRQPLHISAPSPAPAPPQIIYLKTEASDHSLKTMWMILFFMVVVAVATYLSVRMSKTKLEREAVEATIVAQAAVPLAITAANVL